MRRDCLVPGLVVSVLMALGTSASAQVTLNVNTWVPPAHLLVADVTMPFCKDVEAATQGRVKCNLLPKAVVAPLLVYPRHPFASQPFDQFVGTLPDWVLRKREQGAIIELEGPADEISSTDLREMVRQGRPAADHLPPAVAEFISKNGLYANEARRWEADAD